MHASHPTQDSGFLARRDRRVTLCSRHLLAATLQAPQSAACRTLTATRTRTASSQSWPTLSSALGANAAGGCAHAASGQPAGSTMQTVALDRCGGGSSDADTAPKQPDQLQARLARKVVTCPDSMSLDGAPPSARHDSHSPGSSMQHSPPETSPDTSSSSGGHHRLSQQHGASPPSCPADAARFLQALAASEASVLALAVLAHANLLPCGPAGARAALPDDGHAGALVRTLAYCHELAVRGGLSGAALTDTAFRMLLWTVEAFHSQYRACVHIGAHDYIFYASGCGHDDPLVVDTLQEEVPEMVALQLQLLKASGWRLWVQEPELHAAAAALAAAGGGELLRAVLTQVQQRVRHFEALRRLVAGQQQQQQLVSLQQPQPALAPVAAAAAPQAAAAAAPDEGRVFEMQDADSSADALVTVLEAPRQQAVVRPGNSSSSSSSHSSASGGLKAAKAQLLQLASREQSVGRKRRCGSMAGSLPPLQPGGRQPQDRAAAAGVVAAPVASLSAVVAGGRRLVMRAVRAAQAATQHLGCLTQ